MDHAVYNLLQEITGDKPRVFFSFPLPFQGVLFILFFKPRVTPPQHRVTNLPPGALNREKCHTRKAN